MDQGDLGFRGLGVRGLGFRGSYDLSWRPKPCQARRCFFSNPPDTRRLTMTSVALSVTSAPCQVGQDDDENEDQQGQQYESQQGGEDDEAEL